MMGRFLEIAAMILHGFSTFTLFHITDVSSSYSMDHRNISMRVGEITEMAWKMTGKSLRETFKYTSSQSGTGEE